jgi:hypothetical protein
MHGGFVALAALQQVCKFFDGDLQILDDSAQSLPL